MSVPNHSQYVNSFNLRNQVKNFQGYLFNFIYQGTNYSAFETNVIVNEITSKIALFFPDVTLPGQLLFSAVDAEEPAGKKISDCEKKNITLTLISPNEDNIKLSSSEIRRKKIIRLANEALEQGALLTQEDLSVILNSNVRTIRKDIKILKDKDQIITNEDVGNLVSLSSGTISRYVREIEKEKGIVIPNVLI